MYSAKIKGSRYICVLETDNNQWYIKLKLDDVVEAEVPITHMTEISLKDKMGEVFKMVNFQIHSFQLDLVHQEIIDQIPHLLGASETEKRNLITGEEEGDISDLVGRVRALERTVKALEDRLERVELLTGK